jgi:hypothetical protein
MATLTLTFTAGSETGATLRRLATAIEQAAMVVPDRLPTGASTVFTIDNAPATGSVSVTVTSGPYTSATYTV